MVLLCLLKVIYLHPKKNDALEQCISFQIMSILGSYVCFQGCKTNQSTRSHRILDFYGFHEGKSAVAVHGWYGDVLMSSTILSWTNKTPTLHRRCPELKTSWRFHPLWKNMFVKMASSSPKRDENKKYLKPPSRLLKRTWMVKKNGHMNTGILGDVGKYSNIAMFQTGHLEKAVLKRFRTWSWNLGKLTFRCRCSNPMGW